MDNFVLEWEVVDAAAEIPRVPVLTENCRSAKIDLQEFGNRHNRCLHLHPVVKQPWNTCHPGASEMVQPAQIIFTLERKTVALEPAVDRDHSVSSIIDGDTRAKKIGREYHAAI